MNLSKHRPINFAEITIICQNNKRTDDTEPSPLKRPPPPNKTRIQINILLRNRLSVYRFMFHIFRMRSGLSHKRDLGPFRLRPHHCGRRRVKIREIFISRVGFLCDVASCNLAKVELLCISYIGPGR